MTGAGRARRIAALPVGLALALLAPGCGHSLPWSGLPARPVAMVPASMYPSDSAVVLLQEDRRLMVVGYRQTPFYEEQHHEVRQVLSEAGFEHAAVRIPMWRSAELRMLEARTVAPDGTVHPVDARAILTDEVRLGPEDGDRVVAKVFRFPNVAVGSRLEFAYTVRTPAFYRSFHKIVAGALPVRHYHLDLRVSPEIRYALRVYNTSAKPTVKDEGGLARIELTVDEVPGDESEHYTPSRLLRSPYWLFRTKQLWIGTSIQTVADDWPHAFEREAHRLQIEPGKVVEGADLSLPGAPCPDGACVLARALDHVRARVELIKAREGDRPRTLKDVLASGTATEDERALLIYHLLAHAGLSPHMAFLNESTGGVPDKTFPSGGALFDTMLVHVPAQKGLAATWIDPACEECAPGEVRPRRLGAEALEAWMDRGRLRDEPRAEIVRIEGRPGPASSLERRCQIDLLPGGDATASLSRVETGEWAVAWRQRTRSYSAEDWQAEVRRGLAAAFSTARLDEAPPPEPDRARGALRYDVRFRLPGYATPDEAAAGERLVVPLSVLHNRWNDELLHLRRHYALRVPVPEQIDETVVFRLPPGYQPVDLPVAAPISSPLLDASLSVTAEGDRVVVRRSLRVKAGSWPVSAYPELRQAVRAYAELRKKVLVIGRSGAPATPPAPAPAKPAAIASPR